MAITTTTTTSVISESTLSVFISARSPVSVVLIIALALTVTSAVSIVWLATSVVGGVGLESARLDVIILLVTVLLLAHDLELMVLELWLVLLFEE